MAELIGTALMILLGNGVVANVLLPRTKGNRGGWIVITTGWALAVFVGVVVAGPFSGAHLNPAAKLAVFCTSPAIPRRALNFAGELIATFVLIFSVFYITDGSLVVPADGTTLPVGLGSVGALPVACVVWVIGLSLGGTTGYAINPARDFAPRLMHALLPLGPGKGSSRWGYAWIPVVAPLCGSALAALLFLLI